MTDDFKWSSLLAQTLVEGGAEGEQRNVSVDSALDGKHVGIYFSAHWCESRVSTPTNHIECSCLQDLV